MKEEEKDFYRVNLEQYNADDARRFGWWSNHTQEARFIQIVKLIRWGCTLAGRDPRSVSILDFGCGDGLLFSFMNALGIGNAYVGVDAIHENTDRGWEREEKEGLPASFITHSWDGEEPLPGSENIDFIVESGVFSTSPSAQREPMIKQLFETPNIGFAGTFLMPSRVLESINPILCLIRPEDIVKLVDLDEYLFVMWGDYMEHDFALGVFKRNAKN